MIWHAATDWDDLKLFLPKAAAAKLEVWAYLVPHRIITFDTEFGKRRGSVDPAEIAFSF